MKKRNYDDSLSLKEATVELRERSGMGVTSRTGDSAMKANQVPKKDQDKKNYSRKEFEKQIKGLSKSKPLPTKTKSTWKAQPY